MGRLSEKYVAGFLDADGCIRLVLFRTNRPMMALEFSQKTCQDEVLSLIQRDYGGNISYEVRSNGESYSKLRIGGKSASQVLSRIKQHLVIKRHYAEVCMDLYSREIAPEEYEKVREYLKIQRRQKSLPLPNFPPRKWLAGYLDGDGCFSVTGLRKPFGQAQMVLHVAASDFDTEGIEVIQKVFGGAIHNMCDGRVRQLVVSFSAKSKVEEVLSYCAGHMIVKRSQAEFLLRCAAMGHFRDGKNIKAAMQHLKAHPHRLNEPKPNIDALVKTVQDLPPNERSQEDYSRAAYEAHATRRAKRQSDLLLDRRVSSS